MLCLINGNKFHQLKPFLPDKADTSVFSPREGGTMTHSDSIPVGFSILEPAFRPVSR